MRKLLLTLSLIVAICIGFTSCEDTSDKSATANVIRYFAINNNDSIPEMVWSELLTNETTQDI